MLNVTNKIGEIIMISIFRLEEIRSYESEEQWYRDASIWIVGHYSSLDKAIEAMRKNNQETWDAEEIMAYMVKEIAVDGKIGEVSWMSVRTYDAQGCWLMNVCRIITYAISLKGEIVRRFDSRLATSWRFWSVVGFIRLS